MKIICIGRNYHAHAKELNNPVPKEPVFFLKPDTALLPKRHPFYIPSFSNDVHYEAELVIRIAKLGKKIDVKHASRYYHEIGLGLDFTARDIQRNCKEKGLPWEKAKAFDHSSPVSEQFLPLKDFAGKTVPFRLEKNGQPVQEGNSGEMIFGFDEIIAYVSQFMTLKIGDLIFTGTPSGVGKVDIGDRLVGYIENREMLKVNVK